MKIKPAEGDLFQDFNGIIFDTKGLVHPPSKIVAFPRFIPDPLGNRGQKGSRYKKIYSISARFEFLEKNFPQYIVCDPTFDENICEVPLKNVKHYYKPANRLRELRHSEKVDELERDALELVEVLKSGAKVPWDKMGISGSLLVKLHTPNSDIDPIIYGSENCRKVHRALRALTQDSKSPVKTYQMKGLRKLFQFRVRDTRMSFRDFKKVESRKVMQGVFQNREYFMRFVKDWSEIHSEYAAVCYKNVGYAKIKAKVEDDSEAIFTPCNYKIKNVDILEGMRFPIEEIASFRGRFCEQARTGEVVIAQGKVEHVVDRKQNREYFRLLLGNRPSDYMVLV